MSKDKLKIVVSVLLKERGYTREEIKYGLSKLSDNIEITKTKILNCAELSEDLIKAYRDYGYIGTPLYQGIAYFWGYKYRFWMRGDAHGNGYKGMSVKQARKTIHNKFLAEGLELLGETERHDEIINKVFGMNEYKQSEDKILKEIRE